MGKSKLYYCDFCNRSFQDNVTARKNHLKSSIHSRNRNMWYQKFKGKYSISFCSATKLTLLPPLFFLIYV